MSKSGCIEAFESLVILRKAVSPSLQVKILEIILDEKLNYKAHVARASQKRVYTALALKRLQNLRSETAQRLFQARMIQVVDYASPIWSLGLSASLINNLNIPQKIGGKAIIGFFCIVTLTIAELEAGLKYSTIQYHKQQLWSWVKWHTKLFNHRFWKCCQPLTFQAPA